MLLYVHATWLESSNVKWTFQVNMHSICHGRLSIGEEEKRIKDVIELKTQLKGNYSIFSL
jgi:hypothetical protein